MADNIEEVAMANKQHLVIINSQDRHTVFDSQASIDGEIFEAEEEDQVQQGQGVNVNESNSYSVVYHIGGSQAFLAQTQGTETVDLETKEDPVEFDVERVLEKQETHDLFCPNCNSCITKRVILRPRKRKIQEISPAEEIPDPFPEDPEILEDTAFRCLSCFSIFIPIGRGFKIFGFWGQASEENLAEADPAATHGNEVVTVEEGRPIHGLPRLLPKQGGNPSLLPSTSGNQQISMAVDAHYTKRIPLHSQLTKVDTTPTDSPVNIVRGKGKQQSAPPLIPPGNDTGSVLSAALDGGNPQIDIIKSMVYGGLLEAITSLSVVTSAAGSNAKTLNIVAMGAANMFGGLFILGHNLRVLKHEKSDQHYEQVLGRPEHFPFHSIVAVLSYLVFGMLPPLIYGFSFSERDNRDYKLIAVALASLICIVILSLAKSYVRTPPTPKAYMKTLVYYLSLWITACGVSYAAGHLLYFLLQKLRLFESIDSLAMPVGEFRAMKMPWASN